MKAMGIQDLPEQVVAVSFFGWPVKPHQEHGVFFHACGIPCPQTTMSSFRIQ